MGEVGESGKKKKKKKRAKCKTYMKPSTMIHPHLSYNDANGVKCFYF